MCSLLNLQYKAGQIASASLNQHFLLKHAISCFYLCAFSTNSVVTDLIDVFAVNVQAPPFLAGAKTVVNVYH